MRHHQPHYYYSGELREEVGVDRHERPLENDCVPRRPSTPPPVGRTIQFGAFTKKTDPIFVGLLDMMHSCKS